MTCFQNGGHDVLKTENL